MLRCIIVDDEIPSCDELSHLLSEMEGVEVLASTHSGTDALAATKMLKPDAVFLDIKMPSLDGFDVAKELMTFHNPPLIVFATAYDDYAVEAFDIKAIDYILKPFSKDRLSKTVERLKASKARTPDISTMKEIIDRLTRASSKKNVVRVSVVEKGKILLISPGDISFCRAYYGQSEIFTRDRSYVSPASLDDLEERLRDENFFRVHRSYLVNLEYIRDMVPYINGKYLITLHDGRAGDIPVSRRRAKSLREILVM